MPTTRRVSIKIALDGYEEYQATVAKLNQQNKLLESELSVIDSSYRNNADSLEHLTERQKTLQKIHDNEVDKLNTIGNRLDYVRQKQKEYAVAVEEAQKKVENDIKVIADYKKEIEIASQWLAIISKEQGSNSEAAQRQRDYINDLNLHLRMYKAQLVEDNEALEKATAYYNTATNEVGKMEIAYNNQKVAVDNSTKALQDNASAIVATEPVWDVIKSKMEAVASGAEALGKAVEPLKKILDDSAKAAIDFESSFAGIEKTFQGSEEELNQYREDIKKMSTEIPMTTKELAKIGETAGQLGIKGDTIKDFTEVVAALGVTTNISSSEAATLLAQFENVANFTAKEGAQGYEKFASALVHLGNNSATTEQDIMKMAQRFASAGTLAGLSAPEILGLSAALSSVGVQAESGGTSLTKLTQYIQRTVENYSISIDEFAEKTGLSGKKLKEAYKKQQKEAEEWASAMGHSAEDFARIWKEDPVEAINLFIEHLNDIYESGGSVMKTLDDLGFGEVRLRNATMSLAASEKGLSYYVDLANEAWDENNALQKEAQKRYDTTESKQQMLKNSIELVKVEIGNALLPVISQLATAFRDILVPLADWISKNPELFESIAKGVLAITAFTTAISGVNSAMQLIQGIMNPTSLAIAGIAIAVGTVVDMIAKYQESLPPAARTVDEFRTVSEKAQEAVGNFNKELDDSVKYADGYSEEALKLVDHLKELEEAGLNTADAQEEYRLTVEKLNTIMPDLNLTIDKETGLVSMNTDLIRKNILAWRDRMKLQAYEKKYKELVEKQIELEDEAIKLSNEKTAVEIENQKKRAKVIALETELRQLHNKAYSATGGEVIEIQNRINQIVDNELPRAEKAYKESRKELENVTQAIADNETEQRYLQREMNRTEEAMGLVREESEKTALTIYEQFNLSSDLEKRADESMKAYRKRLKKAGIDDGTIKAVCQEIGTSVSEAFGISKKLEPKADESMEAYRKRLKKAGMKEEEINAIISWIQKKMDISDEMKEEGEKAGKQFFAGFDKGIASKALTTANTMRKAAKSASAAFANTLEIQSPSKVAMRQAQYFMDGYILGVHNREKAWVDSVEEIANEGIETYNDAMDKMDTEMAKSGMFDFDNANANIHSTIEVQQDSDTKNMINNIAKAVVEYLPQMSNMQVVMDSNRLVGQLAPKIDTYFTQQQFANERGI